MPALPRRYALWQERLCHAFFADTGGKPVLLYVDDEELRRLAPDAEPDAGSQLAAAVNELVQVARGRAMFSEVCAAAKEWHMGDRDEPPPVLPVLAISVLAATCMHTDAHARRNNYYLRLAQALCPGAAEDRIEHARYALREGGAFVEVAAMWQELHKWMTLSGGRHGISTVRDHPDRTRIGYAQSQALIRRSDRAVLTKFFAALDLPELGVPSGEGLLDYLELWAARPRGLSESLRAAFADDTLRHLLKPLLIALAERWDGRVVTAEGLRRLEMRLTLSLDDWTTWWAIPTVDGVDNDTLTGVVAGVPVEVSITRDPYSTCYQLTGAPSVVREALRDPFRLRGFKCAAEFTAMTVRPFTENADSGGWISVAAVSPFREHVIAARDDLAPAVKNFLRLAADPGWRSERPGARPLLEDHVLFTSVVFSNSDRLVKAIADHPGLSLASLPDPTARPRLTNGLPIARQITRGCYITGGEPDLLLPLGAEPRHVSASLDDIPQKPPFLAAGFPIEMRRVGPLEPGEHRLVVGSESIAFTLTDASPSDGYPPGTGEIRWNDIGELAMSNATGEICGAWVNTVDEPEPVLARRGQDETWIINLDGRCTPVTEPAAPAGLSERVPGWSPYYFEIAPSATAAWLAQRRGARWRVSMIRACAPAFASLDNRSRAVWSSVAEHGPMADPMWNLYVRQSERARGC